MRDITWSVNGALYILLQSFSATSIYRTGLQNWAYSHIFGHFQQHVYCACAEKAIYELAVKFLTPSFDFPPGFLYRVRSFGDDFRRFFHFICWMFAIFLLPVSLTYWSKKYTTRIEPTVIIPTKCEAHMTIHCRVRVWQLFLKNKRWDEMQSRV